MNPFLEFELRFRRQLQILPDTQCNEGCSLTQTNGWRCEHCVEGQNDDVDQSVSSFVQFCVLEWSWEEIDKAIGFPIHPVIQRHLAWGLHSLQLRGRADQCMWFYHPVALTMVCELDKTPKPEHLAEFASRFSPMYNYVVRQIALARLQMYGLPRDVADWVGNFI